MNNEQFYQFLKRYSSEKNGNYTHTRIADKSKKINGGIFNITDKTTFLKEYYENVFINGNNEYLTEKQRTSNSVLVIDIDMRYDSEITEKQHTKNHIIDLINLYLDNISKYYNINNDFSLEVFVMEKDNVNILENKTKDGIHIIFGINIDKSGQLLLRDQILENLKSMWEDLPLTNDISELIDEGITKGTVNWQMYGSRKPDNQPYKLKQIFNCKWSENKEEWKFSEKI